MSLVLLIAACGSGIGTSSATRTAFNPSAITTADSQKYNAYIEILNYASGRSFNFWINRYFEIFGEDLEPNADADFSAVLLPEHAPLLYSGIIARTEEPRRLAMRGPDFGRADEKMLLVCDAFENLVRLLFYEAHNYYYNLRYLEDDFALGREIHLRIFAYEEALWQAINEFMEAFSPILIAFQAADLPVFAERGMWIHYHSLSLIVAAVEIERLLDTNTDEVNANLQDFEPLHDKLNGHVEALMELQFDRAQIQLEGRGINDHINMFMIPVQRISAAADEINEAISNNRSFDRPFEHFITELGALVSRYNQMLS